MRDMKETWRPVNIKITKVSDGSVAEFDDQLYTTEDYSGIFVWEDGNYSCDCNRSLFFNRSKGLPDGNGKCGHTKYRVDFIKDKETDELLYSEEIKNAKRTAQPAPKC